MVIKLYLDFVSQPARAVYTLCRIKEIPIEMIETRLNKKQVNFDSFSTKKNGSKK